MRLEADLLAGLPGVRHGFLTRQGGVSDGVWASLNVGLRSGDRPERVAANRARAAAMLGQAPERLVTARQVHGVVVRHVREPWDNLTAPEADALVTDRPGLLLGVLTADCGPVLLADPQVPVIGAIHAGWRGALDGVLEAAVAAMAALGAMPERMLAAVGPCIAQPSYEVGPEFAARFAAADDASGTSFRPGPGDRTLFDLKGYCATRLARAGVRRIEILPHDTGADEERFFSFRRTTRQGGGRFGLQLSAIALD